MAKKAYKYIEVSGCCKEPVKYDEHDVFIICPKCKKRCVPEIIKEVILKGKCKMCNCTLSLENMSGYCSECLCIVEDSGFFD